MRPSPRLIGVWLLVLGGGWPLGLTAQSGATVVGTVILHDRGDQAPEDLGQAVVWLEAVAPAAIQPATSAMIIQDKQFLPLQLRDLFII